MGVDRETILKIKHVLKSEVHKGKETSPQHPQIKHFGSCNSLKSQIFGTKVQVINMVQIFDCTRPKSNHLLQTYVLLIKCLHKCQWDFTFEVIGEH